MAKIASSDESCAKCCREMYKQQELALSRSNKLWLQISWWSILGCLQRDIFEKNSPAAQSFSLGTRFRRRPYELKFKKIASQELIIQNQKVKSIFCTLQAQMIRCLNAFDHVIFL